MKQTFWVKLLILVGVALSSGAQCADEPSRNEVVRIARSLDELVDQHPLKDEIIKNGKRAKTAPLPVDLRFITPVVARMLDLNEKDVTPLLENNREKLSRIVYARVIARKSNRSWSQVLQTLKDEEIPEPLEQNATALAEAYKLMDSLYTELAFAALDSPLEPPSGKSNKKKGLSQK